MKSIISFFTSFVDVVLAVLNFINTFIQSLIWYVDNLPELIAGVTASFSYVPSFVFPFLSVSLSIMILLALVRLL